MFYVYVLKSEINSRFYKGFTADIEKRLLEHNSGKTKSTRKGVPWFLIYFERVATVEVARVREKFLKSGHGRAYLKKLIRENEEQGNNYPIESWINY